MSGFRCQFCKGSLTKVHYPKLYNMAHLSLNVFTASKGSNNYIVFIDIRGMSVFECPGDSLELKPIQAD